MIALIDFLNTIFWGYVLIYGLLAVGIYLSFRLGFLQFTKFGQMWRVIVSTKSADKAGISPFQALAVGLASRVGTGNIAGVAVAIYLGGPGAIFWMWVVALLGMATAFAESTLAQLYKIRDEDGQYRGGPAFYMAAGLGLPWMGVIFAVCLTISFGLVFNAVQANSITESVVNAFGLNKVLVAVILVAASAAVIMGGLRSVARFAELVVPVMAGIYVLLAIYVLAANLGAVPGMIMQIIRGAFGLDQAVGGVVGYTIGQAMLNGIKRGLFSNEAGMGSAPNVAATATPDPHHPCSQGFVQALGVFIDTILICTATAIVILLSGVVQPGSGVTGVALTQHALAVHIGGAAPIFLAIAVFFFAFTSIVANYAYAENAIVYMKLDHKGGLWVLRFAALAMVLWGSLQSVAVVWDAADASMGMMATVNLIAVLALSGTVVKLARDYTKQLRAGKEPVFNPDDFPELAKKIDRGIWDAT